MHTYAIVLAVLIGLVAVVTARGHSGRRIYWLRRQMLRRYIVKSLNRALSLDIAYDPGVDPCLLADFEIKEQNRSIGGISDSRMFGLHRYFVKNVKLSQRKSDMRATVDIVYRQLQGVGNVSISSEATTYRGKTIYISPYLMVRITSKVNATGDGSVQLTDMEVEDIFGPPVIVDPLDSFPNKRGLLTPVTNAYIAAAEECIKKMLTAFQSGVNRAMQTRKLKAILNGEKPLRLKKVNGTTEVKTAIAIMRQIVSRIRVDPISIPPLTIKLSKNLFVNMTGFIRGFYLPRIYFANVDPSDPQRTNAIMHYSTLEAFLDIPIFKYVIRLRVLLYNIKMHLQIQKNIKKVVGVTVYDFDDFFIKRLQSPKLSPKDRSIILQKVLDRLHLFIFKDLDSLLLSKLKSPVS